jgi:hypothetical protein
MGIIEIIITPDPFQTMWKHTILSKPDLKEPSVFAPRR